MIALLAVSMLFTADTLANQVRSSSAIRQFRHQHPCPLTNQPTGACKGWVVDHIIPLCAGGADHPKNMQWQPRGESLIKDNEERATCRSLRSRIAR